MRFWVTSRRSVSEGYGAIRSCQSITGPYQARPDAPPDSRPDILAGLASFWRGLASFVCLLGVKPAKGAFQGLIAVPGSPRVVGTHQWP